tara:strand:+ start:33112 stop:34344 length:1233 start_codon:yes stop_codon:yes gene_type:complete
MSTERNSSALVARPGHVPEELVVEFDMYNVPGGDKDAQGAFAAVQRTSPNIFWTPYNGGHWVATRAADVEAMLRDPEAFSSQRVFIPRDDSAPRTLPLESDPPVHTQMRRPLTLGLMSKAIDAMEHNVRDLAVELIESFLARGECDFMAEFANVLPMEIFLDLVNLPRAERTRLVPIVENFIKGGTVEARQQAQLEIMAYISGVVEERRSAPGEDLGSKVVNATVDGERISDDVALSYMTLLLFGGLDTIASMLGFITRFLAESPGHRKQLVDNLENRDFVRAAMEEMFRRFGIVNSGRVITRDCEFSGVQFRSNDTILPINLLAGLDEQKVSDPLAVDFTRGSPSNHLAFGTGPHSCPGATLARREIYIFLQEWLGRIPEFSVRKGAPPVAVTGVTCSLQSLRLEWPVD